MTALLTAVPAFEVTAETVQPIVDAINNGLTTLLPVALGIGATMIGVNMIRKIIFRFF